jgi:hypothetical protein
MKTQKMPDFFVFYFIPLRTQMERKTFRKKSIVKLYSIIVMSKGGKFTK